MSLFAALKAIPLNTGNISLKKVGYVLLQCLQK